MNTVLPFGNTVAVVYVTGAELLEALEASTFALPDSLGGFPQIAGMNISIDATKKYDPQTTPYPSGSGKATYYGPASINRVTINSVNGKAFDLNKTYAVVTNNFCAAGGDTYYAFAAASSQFDTGLPLDEVLMDYITTELKGVVGEQYAQPQGRMTITLPADEGPTTAWWRSWQPALPWWSPPRSARPSERSPFADTASPLPRRTSSAGAFSVMALFCN